MLKDDRVKTATKSDLVSSPFPEFQRPSNKECEKAVKLLSALHGTPERGEITMPILDSLVRTILSQNTTDKNSRVAFAALKQKFPTWKSVVDADVVDVENSIRFGGLAEIKTKRIKAILNSLLTDHSSDCHNGEPSLEWMRSLSTEAVKHELRKFNGVGPKTISCVLMFNMNRGDFPVDTHVWHISKKLGWAPSSCSRETCYEHLNNRIPDHLKYDLHVLLVEHGKRCPKCAKGGRLQNEQEGPCPLINWNECHSKVRSDNDCIVPHHTIVKTEKISTFTALESSITPSSKRKLVSCLVESQEPGRGSSKSIIDEVNGTILRKSKRIAGALLTPACTSNVSDSLTGDARERETAEAKEYEEGVGQRSCDFAEDHSGSASVELRSVMSDVTRIKKEKKLRHLDLQSGSALEFLSSSSSSLVGLRKLPENVEGLFCQIKVQGSASNSENADPSVIVGNEGTVEHTPLGVAESKEDESNRSM